MNNCARIFLLLTAPPATGKTYWIEDFAAHSEEKILVISPLRALVDECAGRWKEKILVMTPEEWGIKKPREKIVIFDEFHLHFHWGDSFRPRLWEVFFELASEAELVIALTATMSAMMKREVSFFALHFDEVLWVDQGNLSLKTSPAKYLRAPSKQWIHTLILQDRTPGVKLIFCQYREEVLAWEKRLQAKGFCVWSCLGGEASRMRRLVASGEVPEFIVATTVLSHGVNLPTLARIYILYPVGDLDFWIQMVARGGRRGESYEVIALENPHGIKWRAWRNALAVLRIGLTMRVRSFFGEFDGCFLKDSSSTRFPTKNGT